MDKRRFLRKAGLSSIALTSAPVALHTLALSAAAQVEGPLHYILLAASSAGAVGGFTHVIVMGGTGRVRPVSGGGAFTHFDGASPRPNTILAAGTWRARRLISFDELDTWGITTAGIVKMEVDLIATQPVRRTERGTLEIVCNIGPAGIETGQPEGFVLSVAGLDFRQLDPILGLSALTKVAVPFALPATGFGGADLGGVD